MHSAMQQSKEIEEVCLEGVGIGSTQNVTVHRGRLYSIQMFGRSKYSATQNAKFYQDPAQEVQSGYLFKSPPQTLFKSLKSWKRRFFVLRKTSANLHELMFYKDENKREKPLGQINLYQALLLYRNAESHAIWPWIQRNFRCASSCVLYMRVSMREYFLIGENSDEMGDWFNAMFKALNTLPEDIRKHRSHSGPARVLCNDQNCSEDQEQQENPKPLPLITRRSTPEALNFQYPHYDFPKNYRLLVSSSLDSENTEDDEEDGIKIEKETERDTNCYMEMKSVKDVLMQTQNEGAMLPQTHLKENNVSENSLLRTANEVSGSTALNGQVTSQREMFFPEKKEICVSQDELKNSMVISETAGRLCVSTWRNTHPSALFHEGDQILAINDLLTDSLIELQSYLRRLIKDQVKLTILRQPGSQPLSGCCT